VRLPGLDAPARVLSGGNMQKLILGRALAVRGRDRAPVLIVANQPTWGLDVGAVAAIHRNLLDAAERGAAILLISEDLDEIFALADRIAVMFKQRLIDSRARDDWSESQIGLAMAGTQREHAYAA
jgi:simple sugar transport system ATP-binding protein